MQGIDYYRIEEIDGNPAVVNNSHAVKRAVYNWQIAGADVNNSPQPEYDNPEKTKVILFKAGDEVTLARTAAYQGHLKIEHPDIASVVRGIKTIMSMLKFNHPRFLATLDSASDAQKGSDVVAAAIKSGAEGVGLIRTEYMYDNTALKSIKEGIINNKPDKFIHLGSMGHFRDNGLIGSLNDAKNNFSDREPLRIRLFDFLPDMFFSKEELQTLKERVGDDVRGTPLALKTKGLYENQLLSIFSAIEQENLYLQEPVNLQIMAPHISNAGEMEKFKEMVENAANKYNFPRIRYQIGAMMETKAACDPAEAAKIAKLCDFVSFGTNDLTEEITGIKRPFEGDGKSPYDVLHKDVKKVMETTVKVLRESNPDITISCCGGQMKDLESLIFCAKDLQLDDVSVPPDALHLIGRRLQLYQALERHYMADRKAGESVGSVTLANEQSDKRAKC